jgi:hypothetical protein
MERDVASFEHCADRGAELFAAAATEFQAGSCTLPGHRADSVGCTAACTCRSAWPDNFFKLGVRRLFIPKIGLRNDGHFPASLQREAVAEAILPVSD